MTPQEKKEAVRQVIISHVPSVKSEITEGTRVNIWWIDTPIDRPYDPDEESVTVFEDRNGWRDNGEWNGKYRSCIEDNVTGYYEIIGRPIQLHDVLVAIGKKKENDDDYNPILVSEGGSFYLHDMDSSDIEGYELEHLAQWDLSQDFDHQSEAFYLFAWKLLCE